MAFLMKLSVVLLCDRASYLWQQLDWGRKWLVGFNEGKSQLVSFDQSNNTGAIDVKMDGFVLEEKSSFKIPRLSFSCRLDWALILSLLLKLPARKMAYFGRCLSELAQRVPLPHSRGRSACYSDKFHNFTVTIPRCYKDAYVNSFFSRTARLWNSQPIACFPLTYNLNEFKAKINRHLLSVGSFQKDFMDALIFLYFFFL